MMEKQGILFAKNDKAFTITICPYWVSFVIKDKVAETEFKLTHQKAHSLADFLNTEIIKEED